MKKSVMYIGAGIYWLGQVASLIPVVILLMLSFPFPFAIRYRVGALYGRANTLLLRIFCGLSYEVRGRENIPAKGAAIVMSKHQSTYETFALQEFLPPQIWVLKKELLKIPLFGWGLALLSPIAIDRKAGRKAVEQMVEQGRQRLDSGKCVVVFPEGTRVHPGKKLRYKLGGAVLAEKTGYPIVPVAHNAGEFWPRHSFIKWPGKITFVVGKPIEPAGKTADQIIAEVEDSIESMMAEISNPERWSR